MFETEKYRAIALPYVIGNVLDLGSGGCPIVPHAIQVELPADQFAAYNSGAKPGIEPQWRGNAFDLPFKDNTVDTVYSSHLLEDVADWRPVLTEWVRVLKPGGYLIIMLPDRARFQAAVAKGQPPNDAHRHESFPGELTQSMKAYGLPIQAIVDKLTDCWPGDYNIVFVGKKT